MKELWTNGILPKTLLLVVLIAFLGISPLPQEVQTSFEEGRRALEYGSLDGFAENLARIAEQTPWRADLWEQASRYALAGNNPEMALNYFKEAAARGELTQNGFIAFGDAYKKTGNEYSAEQVWELTNRRFGPSTDALTRLADMHRAQEDYPALIEDLQSLIRLETSAQLNYELGFLLAAYQPESAPPYLLQASELDPSLTDAQALSFVIQRALPENNPTYTLMASGQKLAELENWDLAVRAFSQAVQQQPDYAEAWVYLGESLQHVPAFSENVLEILTYALELDPQSVSANTFMAIYWQRNGDIEKTRLYLEQASKIAPANPAIWADLGATYASLGDLEAAQASYQKAIELAPNDSNYTQRLIEFFIHYNMDLRETALPLARALVASAPENPGALDVMGQILFRLGDVLTAERFYIQALAQSPNYAAAHLHLGILYRYQGKNDLARSELQQAIALAPNSQISTHAQRILDE